MVPAKNTWSRRLCFIEAYTCGLPPTELHRKMDEPWQNLIGLLGHLSREVLDGQFFALIVRLVGNAMAQLICNEQVVRFVRRRCSHRTPRRASFWPAAGRAPRIAGRSQLQGQKPQAATLVGSTFRTLPELAIGIARGFMAS